MERGQSEKKQNTSEKGLKMCEACHKYPPLPIAVVEPRPRTNQAPPLPPRNPRGGHIN